MDKIRDLREKYFQIDDEYLNGYAKLCGINATGVYLSLCRHANKQQQCFPSKKLVAEELAISERSVYTALKILASWNIIKIEQQGRNESGTFNNLVYTLLDKKVWKAKPDQQHQMPSANNDIDRRQQVPNKETHINQTHKNQTHPVPTVQGKAPNGDVTALIDLLQGTFSLKVLDGTQQENRRYCWLALQKFSRAGVEQIIKAAERDAFWRTKITGFKTLYYNGVKIASTQRIPNVAKIS